MLDEVKNIGNMRGFLYPSEKSRIKAIEKLI
jgi:hypothetical protein